MDDKSYSDMVYQNLSSLRELKHKTTSVSKDNMYEHITKPAIDLKFDILQQETLNKLRILQAQTETAFILIEQHYVHEVEMNNLRKIFIDKHEEKNISVTNKFAAGFLGLISLVV